MKLMRLFRKQMLFVSILVSFLLMMSGCASTWVQKATEWTPKKDAPVLMGHYQVKSDAGADLFDLAKSAGGKGGGPSFADVSRKTYKLMEMSLAKQFGFKLYTDKRRAKKLDHGPELTTGDSRADELIGSIASQWTHPEGADRAFHRIMKGVDLRQTVIGTLKGRNKNEVFMSADLSITDADSFILFKKFNVKLAIEILDQNGVSVFKAKASGATGLTFLRNPISEGRIEKAVAQALANLEKAKVEQGVSAITSM
ncbi:MAG: hypothetical protein GY866_09675 [Proteobacteria bacterium]|nr:hypothetical protein [Pseudomonadota bacterium]